jgi:hypothetical protein
MYSTATNIFDLRTIARLLGGEVSSGQVLAPGPNHSAKDRSLSVKVSPSAPDGFVVNSFAGDDPIACKDYVRSKLGLGQFEPRSRGNVHQFTDTKKASNEGEHIVATYIYKQADGSPYLRVQKTNLKSFWQSHWDGSDWKKGKPKTGKIPYRLLKLINNPHACVFIVEGEKDVETLINHDLIATTSSEGAGKWTPELNQHFKGRDVIILPDNDDKGRDHAQKVATNLHGVAATVKIVALPGVGEKGDVSDWLTAGHTIEELGDLCLDAKLWEPTAANENEPAAESEGGLTLNDFYAYMRTHSYIFAGDRTLWPAASVNSRIAPVPLVDSDGNPIANHKGEQQTMSATAWLDKNRPVEQMTWVPGFPELIRDRLISEGGWIQRKGRTIFNMYLPPETKPGDANGAGPWIDHIHRVYPNDADHIIKWLAHRVQKPQQKINHALVLGGSQGIGKDTLLEAVKLAIGPWNFNEVSPVQMLGRFNGFLKSVILRVSEARDLGDVNRYQFYDHMKAYTASPPDVLRVDEKHMQEYAVFNVCGIVITTNHKSDGVYLPADDRRHYVAWSELKNAGVFGGGAFALKSEMSRLRRYAPTFS